MVFSLCPRRNKANKSKLSGSKLDAIPSGLCTYNLGSNMALYAASGVTGAQSIQLYVKIAGSAGLGVPIFGNSYVTDKPWGIYLGPTQVYSAEYGGPVYPYVSGAPNPTDGNWHRIDLSGNTLYVDGVAAATGVSNYLSKASDLWIGWYSKQFICCGMAGTLQVGSDPQVFSAALSAVDISSGMPQAAQVTVTFTAQGNPALTCPSTPNPGCTDTANWTNGSGYNCASYVTQGWCSNYTHTVNPGQEWTLGATYNYPENNCCNCGKGAAQAAAPGCANTANWVNGAGYNCNDYVTKGWCSSTTNQVVPGNEWTLGPKYNNPQDNCCACGKAGGPLPAAPAPAPPSPSCGIARSQNVYNGCGYTYQSLANCQNQCQQFGGSCTPVPFIPAEGAYATAAGGSCGITRGQPVYNGCGFVYQAQGNWKEQCGSGGNTTGFIPTE